MKKLLILAGIAVFLASWTIKNMIYRPVELAEDVYVVIERGMSSNAAALILSANGVIEYPLLFKAAARLSGLDKRLKAGEYVFAGSVSLHDVLHKLADGEIFYRKITLAEGLTASQMLDIIQNEPLLSGEITLRPQEGEMLPETYSFQRGDSRDSIIRQAATAMDNALQEAWDERESALPFKDKGELLILASIIEKETAVNDERRLVASVFVNRLVKGMKLQTDPTVIYALTKGMTELNRPLTRKDLETDSPYNTYKYYGLPPTPICNPGKESLKAAAHPEHSNYLYFVASGNGGHNFAVSLKEHNNNVKIWKYKLKEVPR